MSYGVSNALQVAVFNALSSNAGVQELIGGAVYDELPVGVSPDLYILIGPEKVSDRSDKTARGALHEFMVSVIAATSGFARAKQVAAAASDAILTNQLTLSRGHIVNMNFHRAKAIRTSDAKRQIDLIFRSIVQDV